MPEITLDVSDGVAVLTLNRPREPERRHDIDVRIASSTPSTPTDADESVRAVIVTGAGPCVLRWCRPVLGGGSFDRSNDLRIGAPRDIGGRVTLRIFRSIKPVIAAVNGPAVGFGASMILPMDFRVAADTAKIGLPVHRSWHHP